MGLKIKYMHTPPENLKLKSKFDVILNMEVIEHVSNIELFMHNCSNLIDKNGIMFVATINRNLKSYLFAIVWAEYILRWLPIGTHELNKIVKTEDLIYFGKKNSLKLMQIDGVKFNILKNEWNISEDKSINYITQFKKI